MEPKGILKRLVELDGERERLHQELDEILLLVKKTSAWQPAAKITIENLHTRLGETNLETLKLIRSGLEGGICVNDDFFRLLCKKHKVPLT